MKVVEIEAKDGYRLGATLFPPATPNGRAVSIQPATGVPQQYYRRFAAYLAERGFGVLTFDYRGIGRSLNGSLRSSTARMRDWGVSDIPAAFDFLDRSFPDARKFVVGHSFGGQALGLLPQPERIRAALIVGSQSGYWRNWPALSRAWMWPATHVLLPVLPRVLGYAPMKPFGFGENLPAGVAIEWASWCRNPTYLVGALGVEDAYARFSAPIRAYAVEDDAFGPLGAVRALLELFPGAKGEVREVRRRELGVRAIGHFGFFREPFRDSLWREAADWLEAQA